MDTRSKITHNTAARSSSRSPERRDCTDTSISLQDWKGWGTNSPVPAMVTEAIEYLKLLERDIDSQMNFGGLGGKLQVIDQMLSRPLTPNFFGISGIWLQ